MALKTLFAVKGVTEEQRLKTVFFLLVITLKTMNKSVKSYFKLICSKTTTSSLNANCRPAKLIAKTSPVTVRFDQMSPRKKSLADLACEKAPYAYC